MSGGADSGQRGGEAGVLGAEVIGLHSGIPHYLGGQFRRCVTCDESDMRDDGGHG